jgi:hypothetical protein
VCVPAEKDAQQFFAEITKVRKRHGPKGDAFISVTGGVHAFGYFPTPRSHAMADGFCDFIFHHAKERTKKREAEETSTAKL